MKIQYCNLDSDVLYEHETKEVPNFDIMSVVLISDKIYFVKDTAYMPQSETLLVYVDFAVED